MYELIHKLLRGNPVYKVEFIATGFMSNKYVAHSVEVVAKDEINAAVEAISNREVALKLKGLNWKYRSAMIGYERDLDAINFMSIIK